MSRPVAVIDIGSNSIKVLVAGRGSEGSVTSLAVRTIDARISAGISKASPRLSTEGMARGVEAVHALLADAARFSPREIVLVATSAVRDAQNGAEFRQRIRDATGHEIRILSGKEEANLIGRGLTCDPALRDLRDFYVFDLGGGSLEALAFRDRKIIQAVSLQLGCVRLTEQFIADSSRPLATAIAGTIAGHTRETLARSTFTFELSPTAAAVGTGGTVTTARAVIGLRAGRAFETTESTVTLRELRELLAALAALPLAERKRVPGLPPARADVFPAALVTLITTAEVGGFSSYRNSLYNLRYGIADEALG